MAGVPMIDDIELQAVQTLRQETATDFARQRVAGLDGTLHQKLGRRSHRVLVTGLLVPDSAADDLKKLQDKAKSGDEVTFTADITSALAIDKMVIESFVAEQGVGPAGQYGYAIVLAESPPLPPPAEVSAFGGLGDFGLGDLGFDAGALGDVLGDIADQAGALADMAGAALDAIDQISSLASLADLADIGNPVRPITDKAGELGAVAGGVAKLADVLKGFLS
jgi:HAMP domain-containing protein